MVNIRASVICNSYHSAQYILFPRHCWTFIFPFALFPLLPNFYSSFKIYVQPINKSCWLYLSISTATTLFQTVMSLILGPLVSIYHIAAQSDFFQAIKQNMSLYFLKTFNGFSVFYQGLQGFASLGPHLLLHYSSTFSLNKIFILCKPLHLPFPLPRMLFPVLCRAGSFFPLVSTPMS